MADPAIKKKLAAREFFVAPGAYEMLTALLIKRIGFDCVYAPGYWMMASYLGLPDVGLATYTDMLNRIERLVDVCETPVIADADTGYGDLINVRHTVRGYEKAGVTGVQIEDQEFPKKCGHTPFKRLIPTEEMLDKLKVALDSRSDDNLLIVARTDARQGLGIQEVIDRAGAFAEVGADLLFLEGLMDRSEMERACRELDAPILLNMVEGGVTPIFSADELSAMGVACAIYPAMGSLAGLAGTHRALQHLKKEGFSPDPEQTFFDFKDSWKLLGFDEIWEFEERWGRQDND